MILRTNAGSVTVGEHRDPSHLHTVTVDVPKMQKWHIWSFIYGDV